MGQTLTHGIYLPDEGERNCYAGLAANWQLLDGAVGTVASHTTQIAGKAPAVHTHTKADITDFPVYGTTAGTICEGNDSRLSDARTPVAHTHTTSEVTDLLSGNHVWTGNNQFNASVRFNGQTGINWARGGTTGTLPSSVLYYGFQNALDSNNNVFDRIRSYVGTVGTNFQEHVKYAWNDLTKYVTINYWINADGSDSEYKLSVKRVIPGASNTTDLGTSANQWKSVYAQTYYYNGVAWGLDKSNTWSNYNSFSKGIELAGNRYAYILPEFAAKYSGISILTNSFEKSVKIGSYTTDASNNIVLDASIGFLELQGGTGGDGNIVRIQPRNGTLAELGTSNNKWKTLNGINPGALSFPGTGGFTDIKGDIVNLSGGDNNFTAPYDGWVCVKSTNATVIHIINKYWAVSQSATQSNAGTLCCLCPVMSGQSFRVIVNATSLEYAYIHPCRGNV